MFKFCFRFSVRPHQVSLPLPVSCHSNSASSISELSLSGSNFTRKTKAYQSEFFRAPFYLVGQGQCFRSFLRRLNLSTSLAGLSLSSLSTHIQEYQLRLLIQGPSQAYVTADQTDFSYCHFISKKSRIFKYRVTFFRFPPTDRIFSAFNDHAYLDDDQKVILPR